MASPPARPTGSAAHPRSRGEHTSYASAPALSSGSSPLARGTCSLISRLIPCARLIPARAGNILLWLILVRSGSAHPRSRGEHTANIAMGCLPFGSSPLARGTLHTERLTHVRFRLIPARAGNIGGHQSFAWPVAAHPRSRGEHIGYLCEGFGDFGSSPLARGT